MGPIGGGGVWGVSEFFWTPPPNIYWAAPTEFLIYRYHQNPQLKPSRLALFLSKSN